MRVQQSLLCEACTADEGLGMPASLLLLGSQHLAQVYCIHSTGGSIAAASTQLVVKVVLACC